MIIYARRLVMASLTMAVFLDSAVLAQDANWLCVGGDRGCSRYSSLRQINCDNVGQLQVAWTYHTGETGQTIECTPVVVDGVMYVSTALLKVAAFDAATGRELWVFDPPTLPGSQYPLASGGVNRGVAYWSDGTPDGQRRVIHGMADGRLMSLDARTGQLDPAFGHDGVKDLREDLEVDISRMPYGPTSAPAIWHDTIILGFSCGEGPGPAAPGDIRAFDIRTGQQVWRFHTVPRPGEFGHDTWTGDSWKNRGGANAWGGVSVDVQRGIVFAGLGSAAFDFYGGDRLGQNLFANSTVALDARTGHRIWHFQTLHHDLWDHDLPVYPNLVTVQRDGKRIDAAVQVSKAGYVYVFDRASGKPLFPVHERPVPPSDVPGEQAWPTQPIPDKPPSYARQTFTADDVTDIAPENRQYVLEQIKSLSTRGAFDPPSERGTVTIPGFHGGATWSGASFDPQTCILYLNTNNMPNLMTLVKEPPGASYAYGHRGYVRFRDQEGYPAVKPPWGVLNAIDLNQGKFVWRVPLGEHVALTKRGVPVTGTENFGGTIVTAGGLVFIGATKDEQFHAFDKATGELLWQHDLPAGGYATPCTYSVGGRQFVVIAAGGAGKLGTRSGDAFVAFALPN